MKICFLTDDPFEIGGGPEHIRQVSRVLEKKYGFQISVITPKNMDPDFNFYNPWHRIKFVFWALNFLLTTNYDLYHSHTFSTDIFLPLVKLRGKKTGITVHGLGVGFLKFVVSTILTKWPYDFRFSAGSLPGFTTTGNGVDMDEFSGIKREQHDGFTILCIARRDRAKGVDILEEAVKKLPNVRLNLVSGRRRRAGDFAKSDLYVSPSRSEGFPIVLLEAMAAKLPIVATDVGDCKRLVEEAKCGIIVPPGNTALLAEAIKELIKDSKNYGENGYRYVKENYSWAKVAAFYHSAYCGGRSYLQYK